MGAYCVDILIDDGFTNMPISSCSFSSFVLFFGLFTLDYYMFHRGGRNLFWAIHYHAASMQWR